MIIDRQKGKKKETENENENREMRHKQISFVFIFTVCDFPAHVIVFRPFMRVARIVKREIFVLGKQTYVDVIIIGTKTKKKS